MDTNRIRARDAALARMRRLTGLAVAGAGACALVFAGLAARTFSGHAAVHSVARRVTPHVGRTRAQTAPPLVAVQAAAPTPAPAPAPAPTAPAQSSAPPVVVSGGS